MFFILDTCFMNHCRELNAQDVLDIKPILAEFSLAITQEVKKEILHYGINNFMGIDNFIILPVSHDDYHNFHLKNEFLSDLDKADQSIWIAGMKNREKNYLILSDDGQLVNECQLYQIKALRLPSFLIFLAKNDIIEKNTIYKCLKFWESVGRFNKHDLKAWKEILNEL